MLEAKGADRTETNGASGAVSPVVRSPRPRSGDDLPILVIVHQKRSTPGRIGHWLRVHGHALDIRRPSLGDALPQTLEHHAGAIIYGGPMSANDPDDFIKAEIDFIGVALREEKPFLGVCLGAQMLAKHLGGHVGPHPDNLVEIGYYPIEPTTEGAEVGPWPSQFYQWHREGFTLPEGAVRLAGTPWYENQAFRFGPAAYALQFHAEITYHLINRWTAAVPERLELKGAQPRQAHLHGHHMHTHAVGLWIDAFMPRWLTGVSAHA